MDWPAGQFCCDSGGERPSIHVYKDTSFGEGSWVRSPEMQNEAAASENLDLKVATWAELVNQLKIRWKSDKT